MELDFDLLGDPIPEGWGKRGRPPHVPTDEKRSKVMLLMAQGWPDQRIGSALGITAKTLRKYYLPQLRARDQARDRVDAARFASLWAQVKAGNVAAIKHMDKIFEKQDLARLAKGYEDGPRQKPEAPVGKKVADAKAAEEAGVGTAWEGDLLIGVEGRKH